MPKWDIEIKEGEDLQERLTIDSGVQRMGKKLTVGYVAERYQVPLAAGENGENPEDILQPNVSAPTVALRDTVSSSFSEADRRLARENGQLIAAIKDSSIDDTRKTDLFAALLQIRGAQFSEPPAEVQAELAEFDKLCAGLKADSEKAYKERVAEIASTAVPVVTTGHRE